MMEHTLRCNTLACRKELSQFAIVTTCSHIFCEECANRLQLGNHANRQAPICPACEQHLVNPDDVVRADLNPTEDYKTSVLSGFTPNTIMECAGRALNFWVYQTSQEILYQGMQARALTDRYNKMKGQADTIIRDANDEMSELRTNLNNISLDYSNLQKKNQELIQAFHAKAKLQAHTQELYDKLKRRDQMSQVQNAATKAVDHTIQASAISNRYADHFGKPNEPPHRSPFSSFQGNAMPPPPVPIMPLPGMTDRNASSNGWNGLGSQGNNQGIYSPLLVQGLKLTIATDRGMAQTPSSHRQRLNGAANVGIGLSSMQNGRSLGTPMPPRVSPSRASLNNNMRANGLGGNGFAGYGMSAGLKVSHATAAADGMRNINRAGNGPRVAQRPASTSFIGGRAGAYGAAPGFNSGGEFY